MISLLSPSADRSRAVFTAALVPGVSDVAQAVPCLVGVEVIERAFTATRHRARVTIVGIEAVVHVSVEAVRSAKPRARANE